MLCPYLRLNYDYCPDGFPHTLDESIKSGSSVTESNPLRSATLITLDEIVWQAEIFIPGKLYRQRTILFVKDVVDVRN